MWYNETFKLKKKIYTIANVFKSDFSILESMNISYNNANKQTKKYFQIQSDLNNLHNLYKDKFLFSIQCSLVINY